MLYICDIAAQEFGLIEACETLEEGLATASASIRDVSATSLR